MVTWMVTEAELGKHPWVLLQQEQPAPSALLVLGLFPSLAWKQKGADVKSRKNVLLFPQGASVRAAMPNPALRNHSRAGGLGQCRVREWH